MASMMFTNIFAQRHDSDKNYRGWACLVASEGRIEKPFSRGGIVETSMRDIDE